MSALLGFVAGPIGRWIVVGLLVTTVAGYVGLRAYNAGYAKHEAETVRAVAEANAQARKAEQLAATRVSKLVETHIKEQADAQDQIDKLRADVRAGTRRLSVRVAAPVRCGEGTEPAAGTIREARAELDTATAAALVAIAADGDAAIRQSNALIDLYRIAESVCGK